MYLLFQIQTSARSHTKTHTHTNTRIFFAHFFRVKWKIQIGSRLSLSISRCHCSLSKCNGLFFIRFMLFSVFYIDWTRWIQTPLCRTVFASLFYPISVDRIIYDEAEQKIMKFMSRNSLDGWYKRSGERITVRFELSNECESSVPHAVSFYTVINRHEAHHDQQASICVLVCM